MDTTMLRDEAAQGLLSKHALAEMLASEARHTFLAACADIERNFRAACAASSRGCLESGCPLEGDACLNALLVAGPEYYKACALAWTALYDDPGNRAVR